MAHLLDEIEWGDPIVPMIADAEWEAEITAERGAFVPDPAMRTAPVPWLRRTLADWDRVPLVETPGRLKDIAAMVTAQENACRYCYGAARATLRFFGYSEKLIGPWPDTTSRTVIHPWPSVPIRGRCAGRAP